MKVAILGDTHFGARNDNPAFARFFEKFYSECFFPYLKANDIWHVVQMGDIFDRRKYINFQTLSECKRYFFEPMLEGNVELDALIGNHDTYYKNTNRVNSPNLVLREYNPAFRFYSSPTEVFLNKDGTCQVLMLPWICADNFQESLDMIKNTKATICFGHLELQGFEMYRGQKIEMEHAMTAAVFEKFDIVLSGHFHHPQEKGNIRYVGAPYEITWSDYADAKGFYIFDTQTRELEFVPNPFTMFEKVYYDDKDKQISEVCAVDFTPMRDKFIKVIVVNKTNPYCFDMFIDQLEKAGTSDVQVVDDHLNLDKSSDEDIASEAEDTLTIINKSIAMLDQSVDKPRLEVVMRDLYTEALKVE